MSPSEIQKRFAFLSRRGFGEGVFQVDREDHRCAYIEFPGGERDLRISLGHRWPTIQLIEWEGQGETRAPNITELEPDLRRFPALAEEPGVLSQIARAFLRPFGLAKPREEANREYDVALGQLATRVENEYPSFVASSQESV